MIRAAGGVFAYLALSALSQRCHRRWGATPGEAAQQLPGDELIPLANEQTTRAIDIEAPPTDVWPWLIQMGQGRAGLYTYEWIENLLGARIHNLDCVDPRLQHLEPGDKIRLTPEVYLGRIPGQFYRVSEIRPEEALVLEQDLPNGGKTSWSFTLHPAGYRHTRLIVRSRAVTPPGAAKRIARQVELLLLEPGYFVMERGMLRGIRKRASHLARARPEPPRAPTSVVPGDRGVARGPGSER